MVHELPNMLSSGLSNTLYTGDCLGGSGSSAGSIWQPTSTLDWTGPVYGKTEHAKYAALVRELRGDRQDRHTDEEEDEAMSKTRVVQVFIADPNENIPVEHRLLWQGDTQVTDLTDQELFFEIDVKQLLDAHNLKRVTFKDKNVKEREELLDKARIRDLVMTVVTVASF